MNREELDGLGQLARTEILIHSAEAIVQLGSFTPADIDRLVDLARDSTLPWSLRLQAVRLAITVADNKWDVPLATRIAEIIESLPPLLGVEAALALICKVILATIRGDLHVTATHSDALVALRESGLSSSAQHLCIRIAAHGFYRAGELEKSRKLFAESLERSSEAGLKYFATLDHLFLSLVNVQAGDLTKAEYHVREARTSGALAGFQPDMMLGIDVLSAEVAAEAGRVPRFQYREFRRKRATALELDPRVYQSFLALTLLQASTSRRSESLSTLRTELAAAIEKFRGCGWQDFPVFALAHSFHIAGEYDVAKETVTAYLHLVRRERSPLRPRLSALATLLGLSGLPLNQCQRQ